VTVAIGLRHCDLNDLRTAVECKSIVTPHNSTVGKRYSFSGHNETDEEVVVAGADVVVVAVVDSVVVSMYLDLFLRHCLGIRPRWRASNQRRRL